MHQVLVPRTHAGSPHVHARARRTSKYILGKHTRAISANGRLMIGTREDSLRKGVLDPFRLSANSGPRGLGKLPVMNH